MGRVVLLGAGASVDAGIPASTAMSQRIDEKIRITSGDFSATVHALNFCIGALVAHDTARGGNAYSGIDVERLFSAVHMLSIRDDLEVAPFVASWMPSLESIGPRTRFPPWFGSSLITELKKEPVNEHLVKSMLAEAVNSLTGVPQSSHAFRELEREMMLALTTLVDVSSSNLDYLKPLVMGPEPVTIATLNYDTAIENACLQLGRTCDTGVSSWDGRFGWTWDSHAHVRLLKLHGSIDWVSSRTKGPSGLSGEKVFEAGTQAPGFDELPALVFGHHAKLRATGPFLAMLAELDRLLARCDDLLVIGYSFRDDHINAAIRHWLDRTTDEPMTLIDPAVDAAPMNHWARDGETFLESLLDAMRMQPHVGTPAWKPRFRVLCATAAGGIPSL